MKITTIGKFLLGIAIAGTGLFIFFKDVNIHKLYQELIKTNPFSLVLSIVLVLLTLYLRAVRWGFLLPNMQNTSKKNLYSTVTIGFMINNILPARIGEFARAFLLWKKNSYPLAVCISSLIIERIIDLFTLLLFFIIPLFMLDRNFSREMFLFAYGALGMMGASVVGLVLYLRFQSFATGIGKIVIAKMPDKWQHRFTAYARDISATLFWLRSFKRIGIVVLLSIPMMLCYPAMIMLLTVKSSINSFGILEGMFAQAFAAFGAAIPLAPGYVGTLHAVMFQGLQILGMENDRARALTILYHVVNYMPITLVGLYFFFKMQLSLKDIQHAKETAG